MIPFTRILTVVMFAGICFALIVPLALQQHNTMLAVGVVVLFVLYLVTNVILWRRLKSKK